MADRPPVSVLSATGRILWRVARGLWRAAAYGLLGLFLLLCLFLYGCPSTRERIVIPSPDRNASLMIDRTFSASRDSVDDQLFLIGRRFDEKVALGPLSLDAGALGLGWIDDATVNVCPLRWDARLPRDVPLIGEDGVRRTYRIVARCTAEMVGEAELQEQIGGFDYGNSRPQTGIR